MYDSLAEALEDAKDRGYTHIFELESGSLTCAELKRVFKEDQLHLKESYQFDTGTDPGDDSALHLIETEKGIKGYLVVGHGAHLDREKAAFLDLLLHED